MKTREECSGMLIKLRATSLASQFQKSVIVAGGQKGGDLLETEILDLASLEWQLGPSLPKGINNLNLGIVFFLYSILVLFKCISIFSAQNERKVYNKLHEKRKVL